MMTSDYNKKIHSITYNILNLPREVRFNDGHIIRYTYDAAGTKLKAEYLLSDVRLMDWDDAAISDGDAALQTGGTGLPVVGPGGDAGLMPPGSEVMVEPVTLTTVEYSAGHVYRNGRLERVDNPYGYWANGSFHYHITDHQGNIRAVIAENGTLEEINNYYPYGGLMGAADTGVQPHKYGAKELDRENGLDLYDSHARWYDPLLAHTTTQDPLAEKYRHLSPYAWCAGNPLRIIDSTGKKLHILGDNTFGALGNLRDKTTLRLSLLKDGAVVYKGKPQNNIDKKIAEIIDNEYVDVHVNTTSDKHVIGGSFDGNSSINGIVHTQQRVNTEDLNQFDVWYNMPKGTSLFHEILESYYGGIDSPGAQAVSGFKNEEGDFVSNSEEYKKAHKKAAYFDSQFVTPDIEFDPLTNSFNMIKMVQLKNRDRIVILRKELKK